MSNMIKIICFVLLAFAFSVSVFASVSSAALADGTRATSWEDVGAAADTLKESYWNMLSQYMNGDVIGGSVSSAVDIPVNWFIYFSDLGWCLSPVDDIYYYFNENGEFSVDDSRSHHGGRRRVSSSEDAYLNKDVLNEYVVNVNKNPWPIKYEGRVSKQNNLFNLQGQLTNVLPFFEEGTFTHEHLKEMYILPFGYDADNDKYYYAKNQAHFYQVVGDPDESGHRPVSLYSSLKSVIDSAAEWTEPYLFPFKLSYYRYMRFYDVTDWGATSIYFRFYTTQERYLSNTSPETTNDYTVQMVYGQTDTLMTLYDFSDITLNTNFGYWKFSGQANANNNWDAGYIFSDSPIELFYNIDFSQIPDDVVIQPSGDNIYNYYIDTPSDTKGGDTINNYITNNYTFVNDEPEPTEPTEPTDPDNPSGGTTSGNISVGGNVDVSGSVVIETKPIDINVNVNSGSTSGGGEAPPSYIDGQDVELDKYVELAPEMSNGFIDFMKKSLEWLPAEIFGLLILGLVIAVWLRIVGR